MVNDGRDLSPFTTTYPSWADELRDLVERQEAADETRLCAEVEDERNRFYDFVPHVSGQGGRERAAVPPLGGPKTPAGGMDAMRGSPAAPSAGGGVPCVPCPPNAGAQGPAIPQERAA